MTQTITHDFARKFADEWMSAWNSHDLERILEHYSADVELTSPLMWRVLGEGRAAVRGIAELRDYFGRALKMFPDVQFVPRHVYAGVRTVVVQYESVGGRMSAELMEFNDAGKVSRVLAHYSAETQPI